MLGFVNFRLYHSINLAYPPQFPESVLADTEETLKDEASFVSDRIAALNYELLRTDAVQIEEDEADLDMELLQQDGDSKRMLKMKQEANQTSRLRYLFKGLKFFINREVPREPLVLLIRCFGGKVSWDASVFAGATFPESDETITHQIVDRPSLEKQYISRDYIQPQWVFDCVNQRTLLPTNKYFIGAILPPHLSPFVDPKRDAYVPPEEKALLDPSLIETHEQSDAETEAEEEGEEELHEENQQILNAQLQAAYLEEEIENHNYMSNKGDESEGEISEPESDENEEEQETGTPKLVDKEKLRLAEKQKMTVNTGKVHKENKRLLRKSEVDEHRLQARMVKPRHRNLFRKLIREKQVKDKEEWLLKKKRRVIDNQVKEEQKAQKKALKKAAAAAVAVKQ